MKRNILTTVLLAALLGSPSLAVTVSWTSGTSGPASWTVNPSSPTTSDTISFAGPLNAAAYGNSCAAQAALGGTPQITVDSVNRNVSLWFQGPAPTMCTMIYIPVCGLEGSFGPLTAGKWTFTSAALGASATFTVSASSSSGTVLYVDRNSPGPIRDGSTWARSFLYLQDALAVSGTNNEIRIADGTYRPDQGSGQTAGSRSATFDISKKVLVKGGYAGYGASNPDARDIAAYPTILTGDLSNNDLWATVNRSDNSYHVVTVSDDAKLDGLTIRGGQADGTYPDCYGGGIYATAGHLTLSRCTLKANTALYGGGLAALNASVTLGNCNVSGNRGYVFGAGIYNDDSATTLASCLMTGNSVGTGTLGGGSAIASFGGAAASVLIGNCTLSDNVGPTGADIAILNYSLAGASSIPASAITINNSIVYNDGGASLIWTNDSTEVSVGYSIIQGGWIGSGNLNTSPKFVQKGSWSVEGEWIDSSADYGLQSTSSAINAGKTSLLATDQADVNGDGNTTETHPTDLANHTRVLGSAVDMGVYEYNGSSGPSYAWVALASYGITMDVPSGLTAPVTLNSDLVTVTLNSSFQAELKLEVTATSVAGGTWTAWFDPVITTVGPGNFTVSFRIKGENVAAQLLTPGPNVSVAAVTLYARPSP